MKTKTLGFRKRLAMRTANFRAWSSPTVRRGLASLLFVGGLISTAVLNAETPAPRHPDQPLRRLEVLDRSDGKSARHPSRRNPEASETSVPASPPAPWWANRGRWTLGFQVGYSLENNIPRNISHINLFVAQPQLGFIVGDWPYARFPVHRFEIINEGFFGNAVHPGGRVTGHTLLFRLDGKPHGRVTPFFDAGAGVLNTTLHLKAPELSGSTQFTPQGGIGVQYFFNPQRALVIEYRYMHMSNASIQPPNHGFNSSMISIGFRWLRRPPHAPYPAQARSHLLRRLFGQS